MKIYSLIDKMLYASDEQTIISNIDILWKSIDELVYQIGIAENYEESEQNIFLLGAAVAPLNALLYKYNYNVSYIEKKISKEILKFENIYDEVSREYLYKMIKSGLLSKK